MKRYLPLILLLATSSLQASAPIPATQALLVKTETSGLNKPGFQQVTTCEIFADHIVVTSSFYGSGIQVRDTKPAKTKITQLTTMLRGAASGQIQEKAGPMDTPTMTLDGNFISDTGTVTKVVLSSVSGDTGRIRKNISHEAEVLIYTINQICK